MISPTTPPPRTGDDDRFDRLVAALEAAGFAPRDAGHLALLRLYLPARPTIPAVPPPLSGIREVDETDRHVLAAQRRPR